MQPTSAEAYIDVDQQRAVPVPHRYLHGGIHGTETKFSFYLPEAGRYQGRFFQHVTPVPQNENLAQSVTGEEDRIGMAAASGAFFVETNVGAVEDNAAVARFARTVACAVYGEHRVYGYLYGGSGGAYRTIGAAENSEDVWDGFVPYVPGSPMALPNVFSVRMLAQRVLRHKLDGIVDALEPGGSGDPYAGLDDEEATVLREVTAMGFPPRAWFGHRTMGMHSFSVIYPVLLMLDAAYFTDFWITPGYAGADPESSVHADRVRLSTTIAAVVTPGGQASDTRRSGGVDESSAHTSGSRPVGLELSEAPAIGTQGAELDVISGRSAGARLRLARVVEGLATFDQGNDEASVLGLRPGDAVTVDNSNFLAVQTYHHHQVPPDGEYPVWDQYRDANGRPLYPQRPALIGPIMAGGVAGRPQSGRFTGKMIVVAALLDREAYPWQADWYRRTVDAQGGGDRFRLWFVDNALHGDYAKTEDPTHVVSYLGALHQALRDVAAWVEHDVEPPATSDYQIDDGQVHLSPAAEPTTGVQPVVRLTVNGFERADVTLGAPVELRATATAPTGQIVAAEWDLDDSGRFTTTVGLQPDSSIVLERAHTATTAGTTFVTVRVWSQRDGDPSTQYARIANIARVRLVVT